MNTFNASKGNSKTAIITGTPPMKSLCHINDIIMGIIEISETASLLKIN